jgi:hypothetical protein
MKIPFDIRAILRNLSYGDRVRPVRDWFVLLGATAMLIGLSIGWNVWLFQNVERGGFTDPAEAAGAFDPLPIESVRAVFEERRAQEARYEDEYRFVDPSR